MHHRITYANVLSTLAIFIALGGGAYAAATIGSGDIVNNSIRSKDVKNKGLRGKDLGSNTITGRQVKESSLGTVPNADLLDGRDSSSFLSPAPGGMVVVEGPIATIAPEDFEIVGAVCPAGHRVVSGGGSAISASGGLFVSESDPARSGWIVAGENFATSASGTVQAQALCAPAGRAVAARSNRRAVEGHVAEVEAKLRGQRK